MLHALLLSAALSAPPPAEAKPAHGAVRFASAVRQSWRRWRELRRVAPLVRNLGGECGLTDEYAAGDPLSVRRPILYVRLAKPKVTDADLARLGSLHELTELNLHGSAVTDVGLAPLRHFPALRDL